MCLQLCRREFSFSKTTSWCVPIALCIREAADAKRLTENTASAPAVLLHELPCPSFPSCILLALGLSAIGNNSGRVRRSSCSAQTYFPRTEIPSSPSSSLAPPLGARSFHQRTASASRRRPYYSKLRRRFI